MAKFLEALSQAWTFVEAHSDGVSIALSLIGFVILWFQLKKTTSAAEAAARGSRAATEAIGQADTISDVAAVQAGMREIQVALRGARYEAALLRAQMSRESLARIRTRRFFEGDVRQTRIQKIVTDLRLLQDRLEKVLVNGDAQFAAPVANKVLGDAAAEMSSWMEELRFEALGETNDSR
ncbi:MAG: hypothetical protein M3P06_24435 [Acidobacteriota bacterium]|nr:hypothetical protein [Acidobacteriota bacterium]